MEGLEAISEDEQLRRLLEMSRLESGSPEGGSWGGLRGSHSPSPPSPMAGVGSPCGRRSSFGRASASALGRGNPPLVSPSTPPRGRGFRTPGDLNLEEWRAMSVEERHQLFNAQVEDFQPGNFISPQTNRPPRPPSKERPSDVVTIESSENTDDEEEEEDEILKSILEQSKKETRMTEEEKTKLVMLESLKEVNVNEKLIRDSQEAYQRKMRELMEKEESEKSEKRFKLDEPCAHIPEEQKSREETDNDIELAIKESLADKILRGARVIEDEAEGSNVLMQSPSVNVSSTPLRPTSLPAGAASLCDPTQMTSDPTTAPPGSNFKVVQKNEPNLGAKPKRRPTSAHNTPTRTPLSPSRNNLGFPPTLGDEEEQLRWALEASKPQTQPPKVDSAIDVLPDEDEQLAWALQESQPSESQRPAREGEAGSGAPDLISVLTPEEQMELAMRLSQPSRTPTALGTSSPARSTPQPSRSTSAHRMSPPPKPKQEGLRLIVIDGCNVAMAHGLHRTFSVRGLCLAYEYFRERGHQVAMFLPKKHWTYAKDQEDKKILTALEQAEVLFFVQNKAYDDKMIIDYADKKKGIILSNDRYRDVLMTNPEFEDQIKNRTLQFTWVSDTLMIAEDPFGRYGPSLHQLLRF